LTHSQQQTSAMLFSVLQCSVHFDTSGLTHSQQQTSAMYSFYSIKAWKYKNIEPKRLEHFSILIRFPLNTEIYVCLHIQTNCTVFVLYICSPNREQSDVCTAVNITVLLSHPNCWYLVLSFCSTMGWGGYCHSSWSFGTRRTSLKENPL